MPDKKLFIRLIKQFDVFCHRVIVHIDVKILYDNIWFHYLAIGVR